MKLTDALLGEHGVLYALLDHVERELPGLAALSDVRRIAAALSAALLSHAGIENEILFPALEPHLGPSGPLAVMRHEHEEIHGALETVARTESHEVASDQVRHALRVARDHFAKEEQVLFRMAQQVLGEDELERLGERWAQTRRVAVG